MLVGHALERLCPSVGEAAPRGEDAGDDARRVDERRCRRRARAYGDGRVEHLVDENVGAMVRLLAAERSLIREVAEEGAVAVRRLGSTDQEVLALADAVGKLSSEAESPAAKHAV